MGRRTARWVAAAVAAAGTALPASTAVPGNLLFNGDFEEAPRADIGFRTTAAAPAGEVQDYFGGRITGEQYLSGWTIQSPGVSNLIRAPYAYYLGPKLAPSGQQFMSINWSPAGGIVLENVLSQAFTLGAGATGIAFSTYMAVESGYDQSTLQVIVTDANNAVAAQSPLFRHADGNGTWSSKTWEAALAPGDYRINLRSIGAGNAWDVLVDDVRLFAVGAEAGVPEPASWTAMVTGLGLAGGALRRRRAPAARAA